MKAIILFFTLFFQIKMFGQNETFSEFLKTFSQDSLFQIERVDFPLKFIFIEDNDLKLDSNFINKSEYKIHHFYYDLLKCGEAYPEICYNFECIENDTSNERVFRWKGFTGMDERFYFLRKEGKWFLIKIENLGM